MSLEALFDNLDRHANTNLRGSESILKGPFGYPGGKTRVVKFLHRHIPQRELFVDVFGGSGAVFLNRTVGRGDVFNDINSGVVAVFRCFRDPIKYDRLREWIANTIHSYEDWITCKESWVDCTDDVERAGRWLYMMHYSFGSMGRNYGYATSSQAFSGKLRNKLAIFEAIRAKFRYANVENQPWEKILERYDGYGTVFYLDPPYFDTDTVACYGYNGMDKGDHERLLEAIKNLKGFAAVSGYANNLYDMQDFWTDRHTTKARCTIGDTDSRHEAEEVLWIKEAR